MTILFELLKGFYFFFSILIGLFFLRGIYILPEDKYLLAGKILMPGYLFLTGLIIGYLIGFFWINLAKLKNESVNQQKILTISFIIGTIIGIILGIIYSLY